MNLDNIIISELKNTQKDLLNFLESKHTYDGDGIRDWISRSIVHFANVGVSENIISYFLSNLDYKEYGNSGLFDSRIWHGPFNFDNFLGVYLINRDDGTKMTPILVAFKVAENLINKYVDYYNIIPRSIVLELEKYKETKNLSNSLILVQNSFENKDSTKILSNIITSTELLFNLIDELKEIKDIGPKIKYAYENRIIYEKYSMGREVLWSINNARIIRNINSHNPQNENSTPLYEVVSYIHLLNLLIASILSSGNISLTKLDLN